jgi:hypothetical protein
MPLPTLKLQRFFDADYPAHEMRYYWKSRCLNELSAEAMDALIRLNEASPSHHSTLDIWQLGGALSRIPPQNTAFGDRSAPYLIGIEANWDGRTRTRTQYASNGEGRSFVRSSHFPVIASTSTSPACMKTGTNPSGIRLERT